MSVVGARHQFFIVELSKLYEHRRSLLGALVTNGDQTKWKATVPLREAILMLANVNLNGLGASAANLESF